MDQQGSSSAVLQRQNIRSYVQEVRSRIGTLLSSLNAQQLQEIVTPLLVSSPSSFLPTC